MYFIGSKSQQVWPDMRGHLPSVVNSRFRLTGLRENPRVDRVKRGVIVACIFGWLYRANVDH